MPLASAVTDAATSAAAKRWLNASLAHRHGKPWYIAFLDGRVTVMRIVRDRAEAIAVACACWTRASR